jgi:hypothetical protein
MTPLPKKTNGIKHVGLNGTRHPLKLNGLPANQRVTVVLPTALIERLRNAVYWTGQTTLARLVADAVEDVVTDLEQSNGGPFPRRLSPLKRGRPSRNPAVPGDLPDVREQG